MKYSKIVLIGLLSFLSNNLFSQLVITQNPNPSTEVLNAIMGSSVTISNLVFWGDTSALGLFSTDSVETNLGFSSGVILCNGRVNSIGNPANTFASDTLSQGSDPQLASITGGRIKDRCVIEFDFIPLYDSINIKYVFASEEYPEYANSGYNDVFGLFITGPNPQGGQYSNTNFAKIPGTNLIVSINNVNNGTSNSGPCDNCQYYRNNLNPNNPHIVFDGMTVVLNAPLMVVPCQTYHVKFAIGDVYDGIYNSGLFIQANSFSSTNSSNYSISSSLANDTICLGEQIILTAPANNSYLWNTGDTTQSIQIYPNTFMTYSVDLGNGVCNSVLNKTIVVNDSIPLFSFSEVFCEGELPYVFPSISDNSITGVWSPSEVNTSIVGSSNYIFTPNENQCSTLPKEIEILINPKPEKPEVSVDGFNLQSNYSIGNQWYNQDGIIDGEENQDFFVTENGSYYVIVNSDGCSSNPSDVVNITNVNIDELNNEFRLNVYPNPATSEIIIEIKGDSKNEEFEVLNYFGQIVYIGNVVKKTIVQTSDFAPGVYVIRLNKVKSFKFIKISK